MSAGAVIGREEELGEVRACLTACAEEPALLALAGEPGIGKTVLWEAGVAEARERGYRVLAHRSVQAEAGFAFAGLTDLIAPVFEEAADELAAPRRAALETALLLSDAGGTPPELHAIGLALLDVLRALERDAPVLVALDDLQWLDASSASVLPAALRRLDRERVGLLATVRGTAAIPAWEPTRLRVRPLEPLEIGALHELMRDRLGLEFPRPRLAQIHAVSGGNPYFALELAQARGDGVPESLRGLLGGRLASLPPETTDVLLLAAALARPTEDLVCVAHGEPETARAALEAAGDILISDARRLRFAHPLLASMCYERAAPFRRRDAHRRLAAVVTDVEERARHLALATTEPDATVAAELDAASARAAARGAAIAAEELAELAADRTPPHDGAARRRRRLTAARLLWLTGDLLRAAQIHDELLATTPPGYERADLLHVMALSGGQHLMERARLCEEGVTEAGDDDARAIELLVQGAHYRWLAGDAHAGLALAHDALRRAERLGDPRLLVIAQGRLGFIETWALDVTPGLLEEAVAAEATLDRPPPFYLSATLAAAARKVAGEDPAGGRAILERYAGEDDDDHMRRLFANQLLVAATWELGDWNAARSHALTVRELTDQAPDPEYRGIADWLMALVEADRGHLREARALAESGLRHATSVGDEVLAPRNEAMLGHVELLAGDHVAAARCLRPVPERFLRSGSPHSLVAMAWGDAVEALIAVGDLSGAATRLAQYQDVAARSCGSHAIGFARARGLVAAARGDTDEALAALEQAVALDDPPTFPFARARALLDLGTVQRHARQRRAARETLEQALDIFDQLGAAPWTTRARNELRRVSGRRPPGDELTEAERRVATLAASGQRNKEIAARLFIEVGTVEAHLSRVYRKLGVRSRTELGPRLARRGDEPTKV
jgi:DNA-binding CsgD family transcriptional regulator